MPIGISIAVTASLTLVTLALVGGCLLAVFAVVRGVDGYGNWNLHRDSLDVLQWLHVSKYPPSLTFTCLELGLALLILAAFTRLDDPARARRALALLSLLGSTAFFYYLLHVHLIALGAAVLRLNPHTHGLIKTWVGAGLTLAVLLGPCAWYRRYKAGHPDGWTRYI